MENLIKILANDPIASAKLYINQIESNLKYYKKFKLETESLILLEEWSKFLESLIDPKVKNDGKENIEILIEKSRVQLHIWPDKILNVNEAKNKVAKLLRKTRKTSWLRMATKSYLTNWENNEGQLNLFWVMLGRPVNFDARESLKNNMDKWLLCGEICSEIVDDIPIKVYLTTSSIKEFYLLIKSNQETFVKYFPMEQWDYWFSYHRGSK